MAEKVSPGIKAEAYGNVLTFWVSLINFLTFFFLLFLSSAQLFELDQEKGSWGRAKYVLGTLMLTCSSFFHSFIMGECILNTFSGMCLFLWDLDLHLSALSCSTHIQKDLNHLKSWGLDPSVLSFCPQISWTFNPCANKDSSDQGHSWVAH